MKALVLVAALAGCVSTSQVGPYVKHVARNGDWLVIHKCIIVLEDKDLSETGCTVEQMPLAAVPQMMPQQPPAGMMPQQPGMPQQPQGTPVAPPAPLPPRR